MRLDLSRSQYSQSLVGYTESTFWCRVSTVCLLSLFPAFACVICIDLLPLRPPNEGWEANWVFWIRVYFSIAIVGFGGANQLRLTVPVSGLTLTSTLIISVGASFGPTIEALVLAQIWRFPTPFGTLLLAPIWQASFYMSAFLAIGLKKRQQNPEIVSQLKETIPLWTVQSVLALIYPIYNAIFFKLDGLAQSLFVLLLPIIKYGMSLLVTRVSTGIPFANTIGTISVKLFDALYMLKCMGSAGSLVSGAVLITLD